MVPAAYHRYQAFMNVTLELDSIDTEDLDLLITFGNEVVANYTSDI